MKKFLTLGAILLTLMVLGCGQSEEPKTTQTAPQTTTEKVSEAAKEVATETKEMATTAMEKTKETAGEAAEASKEMMADVKESTSEMADKASETMTKAAVATTMAAEKAVDAAKQAVSPETIVLEASMGNVTFPHEAHSATFDCSTCHGDGTPGLFGLDKEKAHVLCKDCHKEQGAGPTACTGCHKK